jgi:hypothetical protein
MIIEPGGDAGNFDKAHEADNNQFVAPRRFIST